MHARTTIELLYAELNGCQEMLAQEKRDFDNSFQASRRQGLRQAESLKREIETLQGEHALSEQRATAALRQATAELEAVHHHRRSLQATAEELECRVRGMAEQLDKAGVAEARRQQQNGELSDVLECYMSLVQQLCAAVKVCLSTAHTCRPLPWPQQPFPS
jgi:septal ring factor EnvC (AmiA/AmiB activator)